MCKRTRHRVELPVVLLLTLVLSTESACGWGSFAHWQSAPLDPDSGMFLDQSINQPDYWGASVSFNSQRAEVVPLFPWTHGCKRQGGLAINLSVPFCDSLTWTLYWGPWTPTSYGQPAGVRIAEQDMYHLVQRMTATHRSQEDLPLMLFMTRGWLGHNTLDAAVHFGVRGYPLCSTTHHGWRDGAAALRDDGRIGLRGNLYSLLDEAVEELAPAAGRSAIEPEGELVQIVVQVIVADGPLMGSH